MTYEWRKLVDRTTIRTQKRDLKKRINSDVLQREDTLEAFDQVFRLLDSTVDLRLGNYAGVARDGISFSIEWGRPGKTKGLSIRNPQRGTPHFDLVESLFEKMNHQQSSSPAMPKP